MDLLVLWLWAAPILGMVALAPNAASAAPIRLLLWPIALPIGIAWIAVNALAFDDDDA